jgi:hypothetical protein
VASALAEATALDSRHLFGHAAGQFSSALIVIHESFHLSALSGAALA